MDTTTPFQPLRPDVIDEEFDGEAVLVHLQTGCYYALDTAASALWRLLGPGRSVDSLAALPGTDAEALAAFVALLVEEQLVVPGPTDAGTPDVAPTGLEAPTVQRFTDMQDLLMLDPIHDIDLDGDGWPVAAAAGRAEPPAA